MARGRFHVCHTDWARNSRFWVGSLPESNGLQACFQMEAQAGWSLTSQNAAAPEGRSPALGGALTAGSRPVCASALSKGRSGKPWPFLQVTTSPSMLSFGPLHLARPQILQDPSSPQEGGSPRARPASTVLQGHAGHSLCRANCKIVCALSPTSLLAPSTPCSDRILKQPGRVNAGHWASVPPDLNSE